MPARALLALVSGLGLSLAFEPVALPVLVPFALTGFALATRGLTPRTGWVPGLAFGLGFYFVHIYWMRQSIGTDAWLALAGVEMLFYGALGAAATVLRRLPGWPVWLAAAWVAMEVWRSGWPFSGMPWGRLAFAMADTPVAPALAYVGMNGVSFLLALAGFVLALVLEAGARRRRFLAGAALVVVCGVVLLPALVPHQLAERGTVTVAAVQGDVPGPGNDILYDHRGVTDNHVRATIDLAERVAAGSVPAPDFVLWPENSTATDPFRDASVRESIEAAVAAVDVPVVVGGMVDSGDDHVLNQGIVWDPETGPGDRFTKQHPVPYGEYIPLRHLMPESFTRSGRLALIDRDMLSGTREEPLRVAGVEVADAICFDVAYDDVSRGQVLRGAELMTVQTSNASFIFTDQVDQQFAITRLRAIETGKYLVVASTNGITGVIAPDGEVLDVAERRTTSVLVQEVGLRPGVTPGVRVSGWLGTVSPVVTAGGLLLGVLAYRRRRKSGPRPAPEPAPVGARDGEVST